MASHSKRPKPGQAHRRFAPGGVIAAIVLAGAMPADAAVTINHLSDLPFGTITNLVADAKLSESVCAYTGLLGGQYSVTATGSGGGGAFTLSAGAGQTLAYEAQWAASSGQTSGAQLTPNTALTGQLASLLDCTLGAQNNASLIVILRAAALGGAIQGSYTGSLQIMLAPN